MTKKFLALTMVLVLAAGFAAVAQEDDRALTGSWENTITLKPVQTNSFDAFDSTLNVTYNSGGITYNSTSTFDLTGYTSQEFGVSTSVGLLDLDSTMDFDPTSPSLNYWKNTASLTLGGVSITDMFLLQNNGAGMELSFEGETPGGVSVTVDNLFGLKENDDMDSDYEIYAGSSFDYWSTVMTLDNLSLGCCDFSNETKFVEGAEAGSPMFKYSEFSIDMFEAGSLPLSLSADIKFEADQKTVTLDPGITTDWGCFDVWAVLDSTDSTYDGININGFALTGVNLGHVDLSYYSALDGNYVSHWDGISKDYPELLRIDKHEELPLDFTLDTYLETGGSGGLFDLALFDASASYALDDEFTLGSGLEVKPSSGLDKLTLSLDYSW